MQTKQMIRTPNSARTSKTKALSSWQVAPLVDKIERAFVEAAELKAGLRVALRMICQYVDAPVGQVWRLDGDRLRFMDVWYTSDDQFLGFVDESRTMEFGEGQALPGQAWTSEAPVFLADSSVDMNCPRRQMAANHGMRGGFAFPLFAQNEFWGVMEFLLCRSEDSNEGLTNTFALLSSHVGLFIERQEYDEKLRRSETRNRELLEGTSDLIHTVGKDGRILYVNRAWQDCLGYDDADIQNLEIWDVIASERPNQCKEIFERVLAGERIDRIECKFISKSGKIVHAEGFLSLSMDGNSQREVHGMFRDVSERVCAEEELRRAKEVAEAANRAKSDFLAVMSHEIRTPLNAILGLTSLIQGPNLDFKQRMFVETSLRSGEALLLLINDILDISKIESGDKLQFENEEFLLETLIDSVVRLLKPRAESLDLSMFSEIDPQLPSAVMGDVHRLRQVLVNLVGNALKFTEEGHVTIRVRLMSQKNDTAQVRFEVEDTGVGIEREDSSRVFEPFTQVDSSFSRRRGGTGLGLTITQRIVTLMGGTIGVESEPGRGSLFWFELPLAKAIVRDECTTTNVRRSEASQIFAAAAPAVKLDRTLRILAAEDTETNRLLLRFMLDGLGQRADYVENGAEAVEAWSRGNYDIILMDCQMPIMNGFDATREIRRREAAAGIAEKNHIRIIALTANALKGDRDRCIAVGMDGYLSKPYAIQQLRDVLSPAEARPAAPPIPTTTPITARPLDFGATRPRQLLAGLGEEATRSIADDFLQDLPSTIKRIRELANAGELRDLALAAHSLRGIGASLGMKRLVALCHEMEDAANEGGVEHVRELAATIQETAEAGAMALRRWIAAQKPSTSVSA